MAPVVTAAPELRLMRPAGHIPGNSSFIEQPIDVRTTPVAAAMPPRAVKTIPVESVPLAVGTALTCSGPSPVSSRSIRRTVGRSSRVRSTRGRDGSTNRAHGVVHVAWSSGDLGS